MPEIGLCPMQAQGVKLLFYDSAADVLLLDIPSTIPNNFKPFYVGTGPSSKALPALLARLRICQQLIALLSCLERMFSNNPAYTHACLLALKYPGLTLACSVVCPQAPDG